VADLEMTHPCLADPNTLGHDYLIGCSIPKNRDRLWPMKTNYKLMKGRYLSNTGLAVLLLFLLVNGACSVRLTFKGSSVPADVKVASVQYFENRAPYINPTLSQNFTEALKDRIISESRLIVRPGLGDVDFAGEITGYDTRPMAIQANALSQETRLTVNVKVRYQNFKNPRQNWESSFSAYQDFPSDKNINEVEDELVKLIVDELTENIFNKAFSDW
jgi:hypothetical protein